jgi:hypothetical protein
MIGRPAVLRRRPLLRAAAVGGTFAAGRALGRRSAEQANAAQAGQDQRIGGQPQQVAAAQRGPAPRWPEQAAASSEASVMDQLSQLSMLHQRGALTDDEFAAAKAKVLSS